MPGTEERPEQELSRVNISRLVSLCLSKSSYLVQGMFLIRPLNVVHGALLDLDVV